VSLDNVMLDVYVPTNFVPQRSAGLDERDGWHIDRGFGNLVTLGRMPVANQPGSTFAVSTSGNRLVLSDFRPEISGTLMYIH